MPLRHPLRFVPLSLAGALAVLLAACGGGGGPAEGTGTLRLALTDAPACGYETVFVTVERVRVHRSATAADADGGWQEVVVNPPRRIDLLSLTNGALAPLGQAQLPAGTYTQLRLVLAPNTTANPLANAIKPVNAPEQALTTPSATESGLKLNVNLEVPADRVADFAIDFDACKSFVKAGNSGKILMKPVLAVIPILSDAGQSIQGWLAPSLVSAGATVSAQQGGRVVRATPPMSDGQFALYPVPAGSYDLVITAPGRATATLTGVPVQTTAITTVGSSTARLDTPASATQQRVGGVVSLNASSTNIGASVRALQSYASGPTVEVASTNPLDVTGSYALDLPLAAPVRLPYVPQSTSFIWQPDAATAGRYRIEARVQSIATPKATEVTLGATPATVDFAFP